jgi:hypothetical protein
MIAATDALSSHDLGWGRRLSARLKAPGPAPQVTLASGATQRFDNLRGARVVCERGQIWITVDGWLNDIVLSAGEDWVVWQAAPVLVTGLGPVGSVCRVVRAVQSLQCSKGTAI